VQASTMPTTLMYSIRPQPTRPQSGNHHESDHCRSRRNSSQSPVATYRFQVRRVPPADPIQPPMSRESMAAVERIADTRHLHELERVSLESVRRRGCQAGRPAPGPAVVAEGSCAPDKTATTRARRCRPDSWPGWFEGLKLGIGRRVGRCTSTAGRATPPVAAAVSATGCRARLATPGPTSGCRGAPPD